MNIKCPNCGFKHEIDEKPIYESTRTVCPSCNIEFILRKSLWALEVHKIELKHEYDLNTKEEIKNA